MVALAIFHDLRTEHLPHRTNPRKRNREKELVMTSLGDNLVELFWGPREFALWIASTLGFEGRRL